MVYLSTVAENLKMRFSPCEYGHGATTYNKMQTEVEIRLCWPEECRGNTLIHVVQANTEAR